MKKGIFAALAAAAVLALSIPAAAETFTPENGILSIELPDDSWKEIVDPVRWIVLSDGANMITVDHYANGEKLPEMTVADDHYVNVYQAVFSTQNEVFIITGSVVDAAKIPDVANAIVSAKVLKYDTKMKVKTEEEGKPQVQDFSLSAVDKTMYVISDGLNVRSGCSTTDEILGALGNGQSVQVTGIVQKNGEDFGWVQIAFNGGSGYVSSAYLSDQAPAKSDSGKKNEQSSSNSSSNSSTNQSAQSNQISYTGTATTVYAMSGTPVTIYLATNGNWYDGSGLLFTWLTETQLTNEGGDSFTTNAPVSSYNDEMTPIDTITVYWTNGNAETLTQYSDGNYYSSGWVQYVDAGGGAYAGADGTTLYSVQPQLGAAGSSLTHGLTSQGSNRPVEVSSSDGSVYYDEAGVAYYPQDDGTYVDSNGDVFDVQW